MQRQLAQQEALLQNQDAVTTQMNNLFESGLIRQDIGGGWIAVESLEERQQVLEHRQAEAKRVK